jgi:CPA2 family monovalent cation:H+ antiporter-2
VAHLIVDVNAETVRSALARGELAHYGDVTSEETLVHAHLERARALVILINDPEAARRAVSVAAALAPSTPIFVRAQYLLEARELERRGNVNVVSEEFEDAVEVLARVLRELDVPMNAIRDEVRLARTDAQESARPHTLPRRPLGAMPELAALKVESIEVRAGSEAIGRSPTDIQLRSRSGALVVAIRRAGRLLTDPRPELAFDAGDVVYVVGEKDSIRRAAVILGDPTDALARPS